MKNNSEVLIWGFTPAQLLKGLGYVKDIFSSIEKTVICLIDYASNNSNKKLETNKSNSKKKEVINAETKVVKESPSKEKEDKMKEKSSRLSKVFLHFSDSIAFEDAYIRVSLNDGSIIDLDDEIIKNMSEFESKLDESNEKYGDRIEKIDLLSVHEELPKETS